MRYCTSIFLLLIVLLSGCSSILGGETAEVTLKVVDESGNILEGSKVAIGFLRNSSKGGVEKTVTGTINKDGTFTAKCRTNGLVGGNVRLEGYYDSSFDYPFNKKKNGKWLPWNPVISIVMRKIQNPVPMYACQLRTITLPDANKKIGFDLIEYDWVQPYGKGKHADFIFSLEGKYNNEYEYNNTLTLTFTNKFDGIQLVTESIKFGSQFKLLRYAPETGYKNILTRFESRTPGQPHKSDSKEDKNYIFRIRSEVKNGKLLRAMYGKLKGDINFGVDRTRKISITFTSYLNPDYSRNLEFDPKQNLYRDLKSFEYVGI